MFCKHINRISVSSRRWYRINFTHKNVKQRRLISSFRLPMPTPQDPEQICIPQREMTRAFWLYIPAPATSLHSRLLHGPLGVRWESDSCALFPSRPWTEHRAASSFPQPLAPPPVFHPDAEATFWSQLHGLLGARPTIYPFMTPIPAYIQPGTWDALQNSRWIHTSPGHLQQPLKPSWTVLSNDMKRVKWINPSVFWEWAVVT